MNGLILEEEEIKKFKELTLNPGVLDAIIALGIQFFFILIIIVIPPPIFSIIRNNNYLTIIYFSLLIYPILIILLIDLINNYKKIKSKGSDKKLKDFKLISAISFYTIPILFLTYLPTTTLELILWIITAFGLYIGFGRERIPLIRYSINLFHFPCNELYFNKKVVRIIIPSVYCLNITLWIVLLAISLRIYPIPLLLIYYIKYIIQRKYFPDLVSEDFYENWDKSERLLINIFKIEIVVLAIVTGILVGLAAIG